MSSSTQITQQFREVYLNGKWVVATNFQEQIADISWEQATTKVSTLNTIAALVFHLNYYVEGVLKVLEGGPLTIRDKFSFDLPPIESQADWERLRNKAIDNAEKFAAALEKLSDEDLAAPFVDEKYGTLERNIHVMIEHGYYHLGQIVLIKKMLLSKGEK